MRQDAAPQEVVVEVGNAGSVTVAPPTFLELWGVWFVAAAGAWILTFGGALLWYYLRHLPPIPSQTGTPAQVKDELDVYQLVVGQYRDSLSYIFDLMVTKTTLPLLTLLLGYLFGKAKTSA